MMSSQPNNNNDFVVVASWVEKKLKDRNHLVFFIDPLELNLPLLDSYITDLRNKINDAEGYVAVTPEYNRSVSSAMKNTLDYFSEEYYFNLRPLSPILRECLEV